MEQRRYLRCLGHPALFAPTGELIRFRTRKHLALLVYLAVEARSHRRDRLAELLWPSVADTEARHSLATALSILRSRLGLDGLETSRDHVRLAPGRVSLDLDRLQAGDVLGSEVSGPLEVAAFLDGFDITDSTEFTHWKDRQQARLVPIIKDALLVLIDRCRRTGDSRQIEQLADRMLAIDDLSEEAIRAKMEARAFAGDRLTALEIFEAWKTKLADELQAAPSDLVEGIAVRLRRRGWERTTLTNIPNVPTDQWRGRPFIGRSAEYRVLYELWERVRKGISGYAMILGDSGVGKTTLVQRLTTAAGLEGAAISRVQCYDVEREIPYSTLNGLILGLLDRPGISATSPEALAELSRTVPEIGHRFPNIPPRSDSQGETARIRLTEAFLEMLSAVSEEHPVILVVDDLHFADDVSLAVLHLVMRRASKQPVMVLLIARAGEFAQFSQAAKLRESGKALGITQIELVPLTESESRDLLNSLIQPDEPQPSVSEQRALLRASAGYPMVLELLVQDWRTSGPQSLALAVDAMTTEITSTGPAHDSYRQILDRIIRTLEGTTYNVLKLASVLGHRLNDLEMYAIVDLSTAQTMTSMAELVSRRVLRDGPSGLEFVNELVRAAAYLGLPQALRRVLHGNIADRFIRRHNNGEELSLEIAWHCIRAGRINEATPYLLCGAREAIRSGAPFEAEHGLSTALPHLAESNKNEAIVLLAEALQQQGRWDESLMYLNQLDSRERSRSNDLAFVLRTKAHRWTGNIDSAEFADLARRLLAFIESSADTSSRIKAAVEAVSICNANYLQALVPRLLPRIVEMPEGDLPLDDQEHLLLAKSMLFYNVNDLESSLKYITEATNLLNRHRTANSVLASLHNGIGAILTKRGAYADSITPYYKCYQLASRIGNDPLMLTAMANLALSYTRLGEYQKAIDWAERAFTSKINSARTRFQIMQCTLLSNAMLGKASEVQELVQSQREDIRRFGSPVLSQAWALYAADSYAMIGRINEARTEGTRATTGTNSQVHMKCNVGPYARWLVRTTHFLGLPANGQATLQNLLANLESFDAIDQAEILNAKSWLDSREGKLDPARLERMNTKLKALPLAVSHQLGRIGMLDFCYDAVDVN